MSVSVLRNHGDAASGASPANSFEQHAAARNLSRIGEKASCSKSAVEPMPVAVHQHRHSSSSSSRKSCGSSCETAKSGVLNVSTDAPTSRRETKSRGSGKRTHSISESETYYFRQRRATLPGGASISLGSPYSRKRGRYDGAGHYHSHNHRSSLGNDKAHHAHKTNPSCARQSKKADGDPLLNAGCTTVLNQPPAPNNTTQFLITDREERESSDHDITSSTAGTSCEADGLSVSPNLMDVDPANRPRCHSSACSHSFEDEHTSGSEDEDIEDPEFAAVYDDCNYDRVQSLPREEINREMLVTQKNNLQLTERVSYLISENIRLKKLLEMNSIDFSDCGENKTISFCQRSTNYDETVSSLEDTNECSTAAEEERNLD